MKGDSGLGCCHASDEPATGMLLTYTCIRLQIPEPNNPSGTGMLRTYTCIWLQISQPNIPSGTGMLLTYTCIWLQIFQPNHPSVPTKYVDDTRCGR